MEFSQTRRQVTSAAIRTDMFCPRPWQVYCPVQGGGIRCARDVQQPGDPPPQSLHATEIQHSDAYQTRAKIPPLNRKAMPWSSTSTTGSSPTRIRPPGRPPPFLCS